MQQVTYEGKPVSTESLLNRYNPVLALLPNNPYLKRPGAWWRGTGRGDYHPCTAEFFLSQVTKYEAVRRWDPLRVDHVVTPDPPGSLQEAVETSGGATADWEIDLVPLRSGNASQAWRAYRWLLQSDPAASERCVYARCVQYRHRLALQYWYLYLYNDAANTHEGDWETVAIELDDVVGPVQVAYSGHNGGARRVWEGVTRRGDRPVVFVARGSHAAYLDHMPLGHRTGNLEFEKNLPRPVQWPITVLQGVISKSLFFGGVRDYTSSIEDEGDGSQGVLVEPVVKVMPDKADVSDKDWWWMNLHCRWGSSHSRIKDFVAPFPPWTKGEKWDNPLTWIEKQRER